MNVAEYITKVLAKNGVKDAFGIPGGVVLPLIYAFDESNAIEPHLCYHEQGAGFAACGAANASGKPCVAYATKGPGIANMFTCIAEAYKESLPVIFITAHDEARNENQSASIIQDVDIVEATKSITKFCANVERAANIKTVMMQALKELQNGRKGPVVLDINASIWNAKCDEKVFLIGKENDDIHTQEEYDVATATICSEINKAKRPVFLIGDGLRHSVEKGSLEESLKAIGIPVLSSRGASDLLLGEDIYFGYVGSHGLRHSNFILSKADLVVSVGNSLSFPRSSATYGKFLDGTRILRVDIEKHQTAERLRNTISFNLEGSRVLSAILAEVQASAYAVSDDVVNWRTTCENLRDRLKSCDANEVTNVLGSYIEKRGDGSLYVCDIGNNEFWAAKAFSLAGRKADVLISKTFATLGEGLPKAIGAQLALGKEVVCILGDQGLQASSCELQFIGQHRVPVQIVVLNNCESGMILDKEEKNYDRLLHVSRETGYGVPDLKKLAATYEIEYTDVLEEAISMRKQPSLFEIKIGRHRLEPWIPKGNGLNNMYPYLDEDFLKELDTI